MKFSAKRLFEIALEEYSKAGLHDNAEGAGNWAYYSAEQEYESEQEVRDELADYIDEEMEMANE